jgi:uncharacterized protein YndB with AHSA1/START domain
MSNEKFVYVIYIASTPDKVWNSLLDREMTRQYWARENASDWKLARHGSTAASTRPALSTSWDKFSKACRPGGSC